MSEESQRVAIVTGAARGIGAAIARPLAADGMGIAEPDRRFGRIICLSSSSALGNRGQANYSAAKAGLQGFTKTLAIELGPFGITANAIAPGCIVTDMTASTAARIGMEFGEFQKAAASQIPVRRVGVPEDVANAAAFVASDGAGFVSGQVIYVAGGPLC